MEGFVYGEGQSVLTEVQFFLAASQTSPISSYPIEITQGSLSSSNYEFQFEVGTVKVKSVTGIKTASDEMTQIYPNPTSSGRFILQTSQEIQNITLVNSVGEVENHVGAIIETTLKDL